MLALARAAAPAMNVTTDLIVGFPGETAKEFAETEEQIASMGFGDMHIFAYSRREGTPAARMPGHLSREVKHERSQRIHALSHRMRAAVCNAHLGTTRSVLWERARQSENEGFELYRGYTDNYLRVQMEVAAGAHLANTVAPVRLDNVRDDGTVEGVAVHG